jgi:Domain of unknown function (DUF5134)
MCAPINLVLSEGYSRWVTAARRSRREGHDLAGPSWLTGPLAVVMIGTAVYCASRVAAAWRWRRPAEYDVDGAHAFMGVAMAGMLVPPLNPLGTGGWEVIFGVAAVWFGGQAIRQYLRQRAGRHRADHQAQHLHYLHHLLASGAMLYMLGYAAGVPGAPMAGPSMAGMPGTPEAAAGFPSLTLGLALALFAGLIWAVDRLLTRPAPAAALAAGSPGSALEAGNPGSALAAGSPGSGLEAGNPAPGPGAGNAATSLGAAGPAGNPAAQARPPMSPRLAACCEIVMGLTMSYMLITML